jgi:hypothetical protein
MRAVLILACLVSAVFAASLEYDDSVVSQWYPRKTADEIRRAQGLPEFAPLDPDVNRTFVEIVQTKGAENGKSNKHGGGKFEVGGSNPGGHILLSNSIFSLRIHPNAA